MARKSTAVPTEWLQDASLSRAAKGVLAELIATGTSAEVRRSFRHNDLEGGIIARDGKEQYELDYAMEELRRLGYITSPRFAPIVLREFPN